jgi:hypothetical protein
MVVAPDEIEMIRTFNFGIFINWLLGIGNIGPLAALFPDSRLMTNEQIYYDFAFGLATYMHDDLSDPTIEDHIKTISLSGIEDFSTSWVERKNPTNEANKKIGLNSGTIKIEYQDGTSKIFALAEMYPPTASTNDNAVGLFEQQLYNATDM